MLNSQVESILFVLNKPITIKKIAKLCARSEGEIEVVLENLKNKYNNEESGVHILTAGEEAQMVSNPKNKEIVEDLVKEEIEGELTRPQLEALTVVAYRGPVTKMELEQIRGVNCSLILRNLMIKGLVEAEEDKIIENTKYRITASFMRHLGIMEVKELPNYEELAKSEPLDEALENNKMENV
ncbi:MAG TPA: SMC-Scp complex subunit ScpB [Patescibacteria group bacterium]|nr:SMC-Scp complex subunit ScpB [Patescibacteria group bacterium]